MEIVEAKRSDLESFFEYIGAQLVENADDESPLFQPIAKQNCLVTEQFKAKFRDGFEHSLGEHGWRKLWVVKDSNQRVVGHIDLRHYGEAHKCHRVLLGMGVDSSLRKQGFGIKLIDCVVRFCHQTPTIDGKSVSEMTMTLSTKSY